MGNADDFRGECMDACLMGQALDGMCIGMILTSPAGKVAWMNRSAARILELDLDRDAGRPLTRVLKDPQMAEFWQEARDIPTNMLGEVSLKIPREIELKINATNCVDPAGQTIGRGLLFCDVTEDRHVQIKMSEAAMRRLMDLAAGQKKPPKAVEGLTGQELKVLKLVGEGMGNEEIAANLTIAVSTVRSHLKQVYRKTALTSRAEAITFAIHNGLV